MSFHNVLFPDDHNYQTAGGPGHNTKIVKLPSGAEQRVTSWSGSLRQYEINYDRRAHDKLFRLQEFIIARQGALHSFRLRDWHDCTSVSVGIAPELGGEDPLETDVLLGEGDGSEINFQLVKYYVSGGIIRTRKITKPRSGTVLVAVGGVLLVEGDDYTVNYTIGLITFAVAPTLGAQVTAGFEFDVPVRFTKEADRLLQTPITDYGSGDAVNVSMVEDASKVSWPEERYLGGAHTRDVSSTVVLGAADATVQVMNVTSSSNVQLPDTSGGLPGGAPWFYVFNTGSATASFYKFGGGTFVADVPSGSSATFAYESSTDTWYAGVV